MCISFCLETIKLDSILHFLTKETDHLENTIVKVGILNQFLGCNSSGKVCHETAINFNSRYNTIFKKLKNAFQFQITSIVIPVNFMLGNLNGF